MTNKTKKDPLQELIKTIKYGGYWYYLDEGKMFKFFIQLLIQFGLLLGVALMLFSVYMNGVIKSMSNTLSFIVPAVLVQCCYYGLYSKQRYIKNFIESLKLQISHSQDERENFLKKYQFTWKAGNWCKYSLLGFSVTFHSIPAVANLILYMFGLPNLPVHTAKVIATIGMEDGRLHDIICDLLSSYWSLCLNTALGGFLVTIITMIIYVNIEFQIFKRQLYNYGTLLENGENVEDIFQDLIVKHQSLIRILGDLKDTVPLTVGLLNALDAICICYSMHTATSDSYRTESRILFGYTAFFYTLQAFIFCRAGTHLDIQGEETSEAVYNLPWYLLNPKQRKSFLMILTESKRSTKIEHGGLPPANFETFLAIIQTSYSYFMLIKSFS